MSIDDNDNYYILEEEEQDDSPRNFASYTDEERMEMEENKIETGKKVSPFALLLNVMFNPVEGWKKLRRNKVSVEALQSGCFYPLLALLAVSTFAEFFYSVNLSLSQLVSQAVVSFVAFFFGYFCVLILLQSLFSKEINKKFEEGYGKQYTIIALSTLALFSVFTNLLPMLWPVLIFLPIWTIYIMFKGIRFFMLPVNKEMKFYLIIVSATIGFPILIDWALNEVLPY